MATIPDERPPARMLQSETLQNLPDPQRSEGGRTSSIGKTLNHLEREIPTPTDKSRYKKATSTTMG